jgi:hypothetical protein
VVEEENNCVVRETCSRKEACGLARDPTAAAAGDYALRKFALAIVLVGRWAVNEPERCKNSSRKKSVSALGSRG